MKSLAILSVCIAFALAQGPGGAHGGGPRLMPASCADQERGQNKECVQSALAQQGYAFDHEALKQCFESCQGRGLGGRGQGRGGQGQGRGGQGRGGGRGRQGGQGQGQGQSQRQDLRALFECVEEQVRPQMESCVRSRINFQVTEAERREGGEGQGRGGRGGRSRQTRQAGGFGGGRGGGKGKGGRGGDMIDNLLERAQQCGVVECVQNAVPQSILNNPEAFKTAHCEARKQCRSQNQNSQCRTERQQLMRALCECGQQVDHESVKAQCEASTGLSFPAFQGGKGQFGGKGQQMDCSQIGQNRPDFDEEEC